MIKIVLPAIFAVLLAGCASDEDDELAGRTMTLRSEECREQAAQLQFSSGMASGRPVDVKAKDFDRSYRLCMTDKGYKLDGN